MQPGEWQKECTSALLAILDAEPKQPQDVRVREWADDKMRLSLKARRLITKKDEQRIILADIDLSGRDLSGFDLSYIYFARVNFDGATLVSTKFLKCIFENCTMRSADIHLATFVGSHMGNIDLTEVKNPHSAKLNTRSSITEHGNNARPALALLAREHRLKQDYLDRGKGLMGHWLRLSDFGARFWPTVVFSLLFNALFALIYLALLSRSPQAFRLAGNASGNAEYGPFSLFIMALQRFTNSPPFIESSDLWVNVIFVVNAIGGLVAIGVFIAQVTKRIVLGSQ